MCEIKIIIPVYKTEKYIDRCINSIINQSFKNYEIILVDDGSPDKCPEICDTYAAQDKRISVIHQNNLGLSAARNTGLGYAVECNYVAFIDSDDWIHPLFLESLYNAIQTTGCAMAISGHQKTSGCITPVINDALNPTIYSAEDCYCLKVISTTPAWGKLYKRELLKDFIYPINRIHEDYYTTWKLLFKAQKIAVVSQPMYFYYQNPEGIMRSRWKPCHMDFFPAMDEKIAYFHKNGYKEAEKRAAYKLIKTTEKFIGQAKETEFAEEYGEKLNRLRFDYLIRYKDLL